jgi:hypothetical protein
MCFRVNSSLQNETKKKSTKTNITILSRKMLLPGKATATLTAIFA